jgi:N-acyl-D-amino-acid deacylase
MKLPFPFVAAAALLLSSCAAVRAPVSKPADLLIVNARIVDGAGNGWYRANLAVADGKVLAIGRDLTMPATRTIDAADRIVAPGFIDVHTHIEFGIFERPGADNFVHDGVTTVVTGNCGGSADNLGEFFSRVDTMRTSINVASLVGHNTVRRQVLGLAKREPDGAEMARMEALVAEGMRAGAVGFSTGLIYLPGIFAKTEEIASLARVAGKMGGLYATHMRNEGLRVTEAIDEALEIGRRAHLPVQISHFKVSGNANWGRSKETLAMVERARGAGQDVTIDQYPYTASSTSLSSLLPDDDLEGGFEATKKRLADPATRARIAGEMLANARKLKRPGFAYAVIANHAADRTLNGRNIAEVNVARGRAATMENEVETILDLYLAGGAQMVFHGMDEDDVRFFMKYPFSMIASDGGVQSGRGMPHPRSYGTNARVLGKYVREEKVIALEEAVRRMTSLPAQKFQLKDRGLLREGFAADIVIFDETTVADRATFTDPHQFSAGIETVIVNGEVVIDGGKHTGVRSGKALRGPGYRAAATDRG